MCCRVLCYGDSNTYGYDPRSPLADAGSWSIDLAYDGVHFSEAGHLAFAQGIGRALSRIAAKG